MRNRKRPAGGGALAGRSGRAGGYLLDAAEKLRDLHRVRIGVVPVGRNRRDRTGCGDAVRPARDGRVGIGLAGDAFIGVCGIAVRRTAVRRPGFGRRRVAVAVGVGRRVRLRGFGIGGGFRGSSSPDGAALADSVAASSASPTVRPVSKAANPGGTQASAAACIAALTPTGGSPCGEGGLHGLGQRRLLVLRPRRRPGQTEHRAGDVEDAGSC